MRHLIHLFACTTLLGIPQTLFAGGCGTRAAYATQYTATTYATTGYTTHHYEAPALYALFLPVLTVSTVPAAQPVAPALPTANANAAGDDRAALEAKLARLEALVAEMKAAPKAAPPPPPQASSLLTYLSTNCAACHSGSGAKGGLAFFDEAGKRKPLTDDQIDLVIERLGNGTMPPKGPKATAADVANVALHFSELK